MFISYEPSPPILFYKGVSIYYAFKENDHNRPYEYWFGLDPWVCDDAEEPEKEPFDIRSIKGYSPKKTIEDNLKYMIDRGYLPFDYEKE